MLLQTSRISASAIVLALAAFASSPASADSGTNLTHVHGLSFSEDGKQLMIPSHNGLAVFQDGKWVKAAGPQHDYMGFAATRDTLYSSGHPAPGSGQTNPFGLIKSSDGGKTWQKLGLEGESDFHTLATSYGTNAVYVVNHQRNSRMDSPGIYYTRNDGFKWQRAEGKGLDPKISSLAVHPTDAATVAAGTDKGLYLSRDSGASFDRLVGGSQVLAEAFDLDGEHLWFSTYSKTPGLSKVALKPGAKPVEVQLPPLKEDAVAYIAQNPAHPDEIAIATFKRSVYLRKGDGSTWKQIANEGATHE
jgi:photosystem II stability/assembly factor-like uncharacterized protein